MSFYGVSHTIILDNLRCVVEATNQVAEFYIEYPKSLIDRRQLLKGLKRRATLVFLIAQVVLIGS
jgi:hypothetical protein